MKDKHGFKVRFSHVLKLPVCVYKTFLAANRTLIQVCNIILEWTDFKPPAPHGPPWLNSLQSSKKMKICKDDVSVS